MGAYRDAHSSQASTSMRGQDVGPPTHVTSNCCIIIQRTDASGASARTVSFIGFTSGYVNNSFLQNDHDRAHDHVDREEDLLRACLRKAGAANGLARLVQASAVRRDGLCQRAVNAVVVLARQLWPLCTSTRMKRVTRALLALLSRTSSPTRFQPQLNQCITITITPSSRPS